MPPDKIPVSFYIKFRLKNSLLALGTGWVIGGFIASPLGNPFLGLLVAVLSLLIYQIYVYNYFSGNRRGEFEYIYRQSLIDRCIKMVIDSLTFTFSDEKTVLHLSPTIAVPLLLKKVETEPDPNRKFDIYIAMAWAAAKEDQHQKAIEYLQEAVTLKKDDLVASVRLGVSWECLGKDEEAIQAYEMALQDPSLDSQPLKEFLSSQIERVKTEGPHKGTPHRYLKYMGI